MRKRNVPWGFILVATAVLAFGGGFLGGSGSVKDAPEARTAQILTTADGGLVIAYQDSLHYLIGTVDSSGARQANEFLILSFIVAQADDPGIRRAAEAIGFTGPRITLREAAADEPPPE